VIPSALLDNLTARGPSFGAVASGLNKPGHYRKSGGWHQRANRQPVFSGRPHAEATFRLPVESWTRIETAVADLGPIEHMLGGLVRHGDARIHCVILQHTLKVKGDNNTSTSAFVRLLAGLTTPPKALVSPITSSKEAKIYAVDRKAARQGTPFPVASASLLSKCARKMPAK